jgi:hypothetical protein
MQGPVNQSPVFFGQGNAKIFDAKVPNSILQAPVPVVLIQH